MNLCEGRGQAEERHGETYHLTPQLLLIPLRRTQLVPCLLQLHLQILSSASQPPLRRTLRISELPCQIIVHTREHLEALGRHDAYGRAGSGAVENAAVIVAALLQSRLACSSMDE